MTLADQIANNLAAIAGNTDHLAEACTYTPKATGTPQALGLLIYAHDPLAFQGQTLGAQADQGRLYAIASRLTLTAAVPGDTVTRQGVEYRVDAVDAIASHAWRLHLRKPTGEMRVPGKGR